MIHEDDRRILESYPEAKIITAKKTCIIGQHYHKIKTEKFILNYGNCKLNGNEMQKGLIYTIEPGTHHSFEITEGSILLGFNSHPYDPTDDYR